MAMRRAVLVSSSLENRIKHKEVNNLNARNHHWHFGKFT